MTKPPQAVAPITEVPMIDEIGMRRIGNAMFYPERERVAIFLDGQNTHAAYRSLMAKPNYMSLRNLMHELGIVNGLYYFTVLEQDDGFSNLRPLIDWLQFNGFKVTTKYVNSNPQREDATSKVRGNVKAEMITDMLSMVFKKSVDHIVLFSGDGDFTAPVNAMVREGVKVTVFSTMMTTPQMVSDELRRSASQFVDLYTILPLTRDLREERREATPVPPQFRNAAEPETENADAA